MTPNEYQQAALRTGSHQRSERPMSERLTDAALGCAGEAGEFADMVKKWKYQGHDLDKDKAVSELGDQLWYICLGADALGVTLEDVMSVNLRKLARRYPNGFTTESSVNRE